MIIQLTYDGSAIIFLFPSSQLPHERQSSLFSKEHTIWDILSSSSSRDVLCNLSCKIAAPQHPDRLISFCVLFILKFWKNLMFLWVKIGTYLKLRGINREFDCICGGCGSQIVHPSFQSLEKRSLILRFFCIPEKEILCWVQNWKHPSAFLFYLRPGIEMQGS